VWSAGAELRFAPGSALTDKRGASWDLDGPVAAIGRAGGGELETGAYPNALGRIWSALGSDSSGDLLLSAAEGYEFVDWGGADHSG
jgi:hypothetical protein